MIPGNAMPGGRAVAELHSVVLSERTSSELVFRPSPKSVRRFQGLAGVGALTLLLGAIFVPQRIALNFLLVDYFLIGLGLAGLVFVAVQYVSGAGWSVALRRIPEAMATLLPLGGIGMVGLVLLRPSVYPWVSSGEHMPIFRQLWLSLPFFRGRTLAYVVIWTLFAWAMLRASRRQDADGDFAHTRTNVRLSAAFIIVFAVTFWLASYDWVMSLEPDWYSTIFGVYNFAGLFVSGLAMITLLLLWLRKGPLEDVVSRQHLHDLGKLLFAFSTFWMYLWFSQYMLIWYANVPEETAYFVRRMHGFWQPLFLLDMVLNWVVPFLVLMPRGTKVRPAVMRNVCVVLLLGRWLDLYLMIFPGSHPLPVIGVWEIGMILGGAGVFGLTLFRGLRKAALVPIRDPYLPESLQYH